MNILKGLSILVLFALMASIPSAMAADADSPYTVTMSFIVPSDTSFSVVLAGAETTIDFNPGTKDSKEVEPDSQDDGGSTPIAVVTNDGNLDLNFSVNLTAERPTWVQIYVSDTNTFASATEFNATATYDAGWNDTAPAGTIDIYLWGNFTDATGGTTDRTFQINTEESA